MAYRSLAAPAPLRPARAPGSARMAPPALARKRARRVVSPRRALCMRRVVTLVGPVFPGGHVGRRGRVRPGALAGHHTPRAPAVARRNAPPASRQGALVRVVLQRAKRLSGCTPLWPQKGKGHPCGVSGRRGARARGPGDGRRCSSLRAVTPGPPPRSMARGRGSGGGGRTHDHRGNSAALSRLSYPRSKRIPAGRRTRTGRAVAEHRVLGGEPGKVGAVFGPRSRERIRTCRRRGRW